jgi:hypothetical protein
MKTKQRNILKYLIGRKVRHGSPGYELPEVISGIVMHTGDMISLEFKSGCFTRMTVDQFRTLCAFGSLDYIRAQSNALEAIIFEGAYVKRKEL